MKLRCFKSFVIHSLILASIYFGGYVDIPVIKNISMFVIWVMIIFLLIAIVFAEDKKVFTGISNSKLLNITNTVFPILHVLAIAGLEWWITAIFLATTTFIFRAKQAAYFKSLEED